MPGYDQYQAMSRAIPTSVKVGALNITWKDDGTSFEYQRDLKRFRYDIASRTSIDITSSDRPLNNRGGRGGRGGGVPRGRQASSVLFLARRKTQSRSIEIATFI